MIIDRNGHATLVSEIGSGPPCVLVHGLGEDHRAWRRVVPVLALDRRVIMYDVRGHGGSSNGRAKGTLAQLGSDLAALLGALDIERAPVVGFSMGGLIGARCAIDHPDSVGALALVSTSPIVGDGAAAWYAERAQLGQDGAPELTSILARDTEALFRQKRDLDEGLRIRLEATRDPRGFGNACAALVALNKAPIIDELARVDVPALVVVGADDHHTSPEMAKALLAAVPGAEQCAVPHAGYSVPAEQGSQLARALLRWLGGLGL